MGFLLLIPLLLIRFALLTILNKAAVKRAAHFPPLEKMAYWVYQISALAMYVFPFFLKIKMVPLALFWSGLTVYTTGAILLTISLMNFAAPSARGINENGLYCLSRNPVYMAYFVFFRMCPSHTIVDSALFYIDSSTINTLDYSCRGKMVYRNIRG